MPDFDLLVLGSGGGPAEDDLSAYFVKPYGTAWTDGIVALEAGSGMGALKRLLAANPDLLDDALEPPNKRARKVNGKANGAPRRAAPSYTAVYDAVRCFLITHAHLDHICSLVLSAGALSVSSGRRRVFGTRDVLDGLADAFSGRLWPALASFDIDDDPHKLLLDPLDPAAPTYRDVFPDISVRAMPVSHGRASDGTSTYPSTAFFIRRPSTGAEFLFFGDVEPDSVSPPDAPRLASVWAAAAARAIPTRLSAIFIECSWPAGRPDALLYGHFSPAHLHAELLVLAREVVNFRAGSVSPNGKGNGGGAGGGAPSRKRRRRNPPPPPPPQDIRGALRGLRVYLIHCKAGEVDGRPAHEVITEQVRALVEADELGAEILHAEQGMRITI